MLEAVIRRGERTDRLGAPSRCEVERDERDIDRAEPGTRPHRQPPDDPIDGGCYAATAFSSSGQASRLALRNLPLNGNAFLTLSEAAIGRWLPFSAPGLFLPGLWPTRLWPRGTHAAWCRSACGRSGQSATGRR